MPLRINTDNVLSVVDVEKARVINLGPEVPKQVKRYAFKPEEKNGKPDVIVMTTTPSRVHANIFTSSLERVTKFVRASSTSNPFGDNVTGSWSGLALFGKRQLYQKHHK